MGKILAGLMEYAFIDTDLLLESLYARPLQAITEMLSREKFLETEGKVVCSLQAFDSVIATGGSVIYKPHAMLHLKELGKIVYLYAPPEIIIERIAKKPDRGISSSAGQTLESLFVERVPLYQRYADLSINTAQLDPLACAQKIVGQLYPESA